MARSNSSPKAVKIAVDKNAPVPAYKQVVDGIATAIHRGDVGRGSRLPSVRNLALDLGLNVNTVARAYRDLERAGVINTMPGMGTFVAEEVPSRSLSGGATLVAPEVLAGPRAANAARGLLDEVAAGWQDWLEAAWSLAVAEGVPEDEFLLLAQRAAGRSRLDVPLVVAGVSADESRDLLAALPPDLAAEAQSLGEMSLEEAARTGRVRGVLTTFPAQGRIRAQLESAGADVEVIPIETEYAEATVRALSDLPAASRLALVSVEKENWDHEANDVMKIIGRNRWLKMVFLENAERGLAERLTQVDAILHVPRAREALRALPELEGKREIELVRQVTSRTRRRLERALAARAE